jgi:hypothetical protein
MSQKEYMLIILEALEKDRPIAAGLKVLVANQALDDQSLDALTTIFKSAVNTTSAELTKQKLAKSIQLLEHIKQQEATETQQSAQEV